MHGRTPLPIPSALRPRTLARFSLIALLAAIPIPGLSQTAGQANPCTSQPCPNVAAEAARYNVDPNTLMQMQQQQARKNHFEAVNAERKRQLDADSALLLKLAGELKAEVEKTSQGTLSLSTVRKAQDIERLARDVQVKMKLTVGGS